MRINRTDDDEASESTTGRRRRKEATYIPDRGAITVFIHCWTVLLGEEEHGAPHRTAPRKRVSE